MHRGGGGDRERREWNIRGVGWLKGDLFPPDNPPLPLSTGEWDDGSAGILTSHLSYGPYESTEGTSQTGNIICYSVRDGKLVARHRREQLMTGNEQNKAL